MSSNVWLESIWQDVRFGVRDLFRDKGFTATAVLSLALGIMGSTAMYSVIYGVVLEPFPYHNVDSLMSVAVYNQERPSWRTYYSVDEFLEIRERSRIFTGTIASTISDVLWTGDGEPRRLRGNHITRDTFEVMGVPALLGRAVSSSDTEPERLAVLGFKCWQRDFGGDPNVLGKTLRLNDKLRTVVGVMPARFMWRGADVYLPLEYQRGQVKESVRYVHVLGRLKPGVTEAQAQADLSPIVEDLKRRDPSAFPEKHRVGIISFKETFPSGLRGTLWVLFGAVGLLLLIACVNVSNLLLVKASGRTREMAVRASLGASRVRLMRQLLTESILLGLAGGVIGVFGAHACLRAILAVLPQGVVPDESEIVINGPVLIFSALLSVATAILFGVAPAFQTAGRDLANPLKESGRSVTGAKRGQRVRNALVVLEVALSLILLAGAGLMLRTLLRVQTADLAVRMDHQLTLRIPLPTERYAETPRRVAFWEEILSRVRTTPGVVAAGLNTGLHPFGNWGFPVEVPSSTRREGRPVTLHQIDTDYLRTFGISLVRGRPLAAPDLAAERRVAVVNEEFVRRYFDAGSPLGHIVRIPRLRQPPFRLTEDGFEIVGVVKNALYDLTSGEAQAELYFPYTITGMADRLVVRTTADPASLAGAVRAQVYAVDRNQPVTDVRTLESLMQEWVLARPRFRVILFAVFAVVGLAMAVIGVYGVLSNIVSQQRQQIGVRMAVGATSADIVRMLLKSGLRLVLSGVIAGLGASIALARLLRQQLSMAEAFDPVAFAVVSLLLLAAGASASLIPAVRATRVDPVSALRVE
jgi:predicted permease